MGSLGTIHAIGRARLRAETEDTHERLHGLPAFRKIERGTLDRAGYAALLQLLHRFHSTVAKSLGQSAWVKLGRSAERVERIDRDLEAVGGRLPADPIAWDAPSGHGLLGVLYTAEGSAIGGRVIARQLHYLFGNSARGREFFIGDRGDPLRWRRIVQIIDQAPDDPKVQAAMVAGAESAFRLFEECVKESA